MKVDEQQIHYPKRHWLLTSTLIFLAINFVLLAFSYIVLFDEVERLESGVSLLQTLTLGILSLVNVFCIYLIAKWKKVGLVIFVVSVLGNILINYSVGVDFPSCLFGAWGLVLLCLMLFIKKDESSGWSNIFYAT